MEFSRRTAWDRTENELSGLVAAARARGPLIDLTESNPTRAGIVDLAPLIAELGHARAATYAPEPLGHPVARASVASYYASRGVSVDPAHVVLSASTSESYGWLFKLLCDQGDDVLVPAPSYPLFAFLAELEGVTLRPFRLKLARGAWRMDWRSIARAVTPRTRAIVLVHPNNPTGSFTSEEDRARVTTFARERSAALIVDEVFADYAFDDADAFSTFAATEGVLTFALSGLSKTAALPQLKLGWIVASGPPDDVTEALARIEIIADSYLSVGTPVQLALPALLAAQPEIIAAVRARTRCNVAQLDAALAGRAALAGGAARRLPTAAGWYAIVARPGVDEESVVTDLLQRDGVLVHPGFFFDLEQSGCFVLSLLPRPAEFAAGVAALLRRLHVC